MKLFISGNRSVSSLSVEDLKMLVDIMGTTQLILVGDADGVDSIVQYTAEKHKYPYIIYHSSPYPRNSYSGDASTCHVPAKGTGRAWHTHKDIAMSKDCDAHVGFIDTSNHVWKRSGTVANHNRVLGMGKDSYLFDVKTKELFEFKI